MRESIMTPSNHPPASGKLSHDQLAQRAGWETLLDPARGAPGMAMAVRMNVVHVHPVGASTVTELNPLDPGTVGDVGSPGPGNTDGHKHRPHGYGYVTRAPHGG